MNKQHIAILIGCAALALWAGAAWGQYYHVGSVHNGVGRTSDNTVEIGGQAWRHVSAGCQPGGIAAGTAGAVDHRAGFLQAIEVRRADLDTDGDGVPDELSRDNDGDTLLDLAELDGSAFGGYAVTDLNDPDTDDDHMSDGDEAAGMYDPLDPNHNLRFIGIEDDAGSIRVHWVGKGGGAVNAIHSSADLMGEPFTNVVASAPQIGGDAPWYKATNTTAFADGGVMEVYQARTEN